MRSERRILSRFLSLLLIVTLLLASAPLTSARGVRRDHIRFEFEFELPTVIEGTVVDNETGEPVAGAGISGEAHSEVIEIDVQADENGYFRVALPGGGHSYVFNISAPGYDPRTLTGTVRSGERKDLGRIELNYNPFDLELSETSGSLARGYAASSYSGRRSVPFSAQRTVPVLDSNGNQVYDEVTSREFVGYTWEEKVTKTREEKYVSGYRYAYTDYHRDWNWFRWGGWYHHSSGSETFGDYKGSSFTEGGSWYQGWKRVYSSPETVYSTRSVEYAAWETKSSETKPDFSSHSREVRNLKEVYEITTEQIPRTKVETYTAYRIYDYGRTSYSFLPWGEKQTTVTATPRNGYTGSVRLGVEAGDGVEATLGSSELCFSSPASTILSMRPRHASVRTVTVKAYDSNGRLVETATYELSTTESKPSGSSWERYAGTDTKPDEIPENVTFTGENTVDVPPPPPPPVSSGFTIPRTIDFVDLGFDDRSSYYLVDSPRGRWWMKNVAGTPNCKVLTYNPSLPKVESIPYTPDR